MSDLVATLRHVARICKAIQNLRQAFALCIVPYSSRPSGTVMNLVLWVKPRENKKDDAFHDICQRGIAYNCLDCIWFLIGGHWGQNGFLRTLLLVKSSRLHMVSIWSYGSGRALYIMKVVKLPIWLLITFDLWSWEIAISHTTNFMRQTNDHWGILDEAGLFISYFHCC